MADIVYPDHPGYRFPGQPDRDALKYFRDKELKPSFDYLDVWGEEHAVAFTAAKAVQMDVLSTLQGAIDRALTEGRTFQQFLKELRPELQKAGWWGEKEMVDPVTGEKKLVQLGSPRRLRLIYDTNLRNARAVGHWERIQRTKDVLPYLLYTVGPSREHRVDHLRWHGLLLLADDPWFLTHMPPNGYGCKCRVRQVSQYEYERLVRDGVQAPPSDETALRDDQGRLTGHRTADRVPVQTDAPPIRTHEWVNKRTGEVLQVPEGIDPGFDWNPGATRLAQAAQVLLDKLPGVDAALGAAVMESAPELLEGVRAAWQGWLADVLSDPVARGRIQVAGHMESEVLDRLQAEAGIAPVSAEIAVQDRLIVGAKAKRHEAAGDALSEQVWEGLVDLLAAPLAVLLDTRTGKLLYILPEPSAQRPQLAVELDFTTAKPKQVLNLIVSAYRPTLPGLVARLKGGELKLLVGSLVPE